MDNNTQPKQSICKCERINYFCSCNDQKSIINEINKLKISPYYYKKLLPKICFFAAKYGHTTVLEYAIKEKSHMPFYMLRLAYYNALQSNNIDVLNLLYKYEKHVPILFYGKTVKQDNIHVLKWLCENKIKFFKGEGVEIKINCLKYLWEINNIDHIKNTKNLQQIECFNRICEF